MLNKPSRGLVYLQGLEIVTYAVPSPSDRAIWGVRLWVTLTSCVPHRALVPELPFNQGNLFVCFISLFEKDLSFSLKKRMTQSFRMKASGLLHTLGFPGRTQARIALQSPFQEHL